MRRIFLSFVTSITIVFLLPQSALAHPTKMYTTYTRSELSGWMMNEDRHIYSQTLYYGFNDGDITEEMKESTRVGALRWASVATITRDDLSYYTQDYYVEFTSARLTDSKVYAATDTTSADSNGHAKSWTIKINLNKQYDAHVAAHEFGHVFGLDDLYTASNSNKLMYGYMTGSASSPTAYDIKGFNVITGKHTSHSFGSTYYRIHEDPDRAYHRRFCTTCNIILDTACNPKIGVCNTCGFSHTGSSVNSLNSVN